MEITDTPSAKSVTVGVAAVSFPAMTTTSSATKQPVMYRFCSTTASWISQVGAAVAAADGSQLVPAGAIVCIDPRWGATLSVIQDSAGGKATLSTVSCR